MTPSQRPKSAGGAGGGWGLSSSGRPEKQTASNREKREAKRCVLQRRCFFTYTSLQSHN
jgi:hypothetical protein